MLIIKFDFTMKGQHFSASNNQSFHFQEKSPKKKRNFSKYYELKKKLTPLSSSKIGKWSVDEEIIFLQFLRQNKDSFKTDFIRRSTKVFKHLSNLLTTRSPMQCRSHFQKLKVYSKEDTSESVIQHLEWKISQERRQNGCGNRAERGFSSVVKVEEENHCSPRRFKGGQNVKIEGNMSEKLIIFEINPKFITTVW